MRKSVSTTLLLMFVASTASAAERDYETLAAELARLRSEVESLSTEIQDVQSEKRNKLRNISNQRAQLEAEIQREELRVKQLRQSLEEIRERVRQQGELQRELKPSVLEAIEVLRAPIRDGIPFRTSERLAELDKLKKELEDDIVAPSNATARLWSLVEDELRLARENGMYAQTIALNGEDVLVDVARVGMVMLYFRTPDEEFGYAARDGSDWTYVLYDSSVAIQQAEAFFDSLEKRVRVGFFELPAAIDEEAIP